MNFNCDKCGACCRMIAGCKELKGYAKPDGSCKFLADNKCSIYDMRPQVCRVDGAHKLYGAHLTLTEWYEQNYLGCKLIKERVYGEVKLD